MSTEKLRQYVRYEINLIATIEIDAFNSIQCTINDFCSAGLFLELQQLTFNKPLTPQQKIKILFSVNHRNDNKDFSLNATIKNIRANGIGVSFNTDSTAAFEALRKESKNTYKVTSVSNRSHSTHFSRQKGLEADFLSLLREALTDISQSFQQHTKIELPKIADEVKDIQFSSDIQEAITNLSINQEVMSENFCKVTEETDLISLPSSTQIKEDGNDVSLALIEKKDFEDWLDLSTIIRSLESLYETQLLQIQKKTAHVTGLNKDKVINPASPENLSNKFRESLISILDVTPKVKHTLYNIFEATLIEFLPGLYKKMDATLIAHGAPKNLSNSDAHWLKINPGSGQIDNETSSPQTNNDITAPHQAEAIPEDLTHLMSDPEFANTSNQSIAPKQTATSNHQVKPAIDVARNLFNLSKEQTPPQHQPGTPATTIQDYSTEEIHSALTHLQQNTSSNFQSNSSFHLEQELSNTLDHLSSSEKKLSDIDQDNIEVYESLFDILFSDMLLAKQTQSYLQQIHLPFMTQAITDHSFLESSNHPARNTVNHLFWLEPAVKNNKIVKNISVKERISQLMEQIVSDSLDDSIDSSGAFIPVEQQLSRITELINTSVDRNIKRVIEVYDHKQKLIKARQTVDEEFNRRFTNKQIPKAIASLLDAGWQHLLVMAKFNNDNNAFQNYFRIVINLISWLTSIEQPSKEQIETTLEFIDIPLQSICTNSFLHSKIINELKGLLELKANNIQPNTDTMQMVSIETLMDTQQNLNDKDPFDTANQLKVGEWLTFYLENEPDPLKLIWVGEILDTFVFVDRSGIKKLEIEHDELLELLRSGAATRRESLDLPIMDRAINLMLQKMHKNLLSKATHDPVTEWANRKEFIKQLEQELPEFNETQRILCNIEIQDFKTITNTYGRDGGDALLKQLADLLKMQLSEAEIFGRLDDNTLSIFLNDDNNEATDLIVKKLQPKLIDSHFKWQDKSFSIAVGIGIVPLYPNQSYDTDSVLKNADTATLSAISAGENHIKIYEDDNSLKAEFDELGWISRISESISENRLFLSCQKITTIAPGSNMYTHYEIQLGIKDENNNVIPPEDFLPAAKRCQRMSEIDQWVVSTVFAWIEENEFDFEMLDGFSIKLSDESMNSEEFLEFLSNTLAISTIPVEKITFEITETNVDKNLQAVQSFIKNIKQYDCKFSLNDFESGESSYAYLKSLDIDYLKIDGLFVQDILNNDADATIVKSINEIAHSLELETIAENVESEDILAALLEAGVDYAQGAAIQEPVLLADLV